MIIGFIVTALAIAGLFLVKPVPPLAFAIWVCTNGYWLSANLAAGNYDQAAMFAAFTISCAIQFWRTA